MNRSQNLRLQVDGVQVEKALEFFRENAIIAENKKVSFKGSTEERIARQIIYASVFVEPEIPEETKARIINLALNRCQLVAGYDKATNLIKIFKQKFQEIFYEFEASKSKYTCLAFLNCKMELRNTLHLLDIKAEFPTWHRLEENIGLNQLWEEVYTRQTYKFVTKQEDDLTGEISYSIDKNTFYPVLMKLETYSAKAAQSIMAARMKLLRATLNLSSDIRKLEWYSNTVGPLSKILEPPIYAIYHADELQNVFYHIPIGEYQYYAQTIETNTIEFAQGMLDDFRGSKAGDTKHLIMQLVIQYQQAFDLAFSDLVFLALWQILERATLNDATQKSQVEARIITLLGLHGMTLWQNGIDLLNKTRNKLVHDGVFPDYAEELIFILKVVADHTILKLMQLSKQLVTTQELNAYFQMATKPDKSLEAEKENLKLRRNVIKFIQESRS